MDIWSMIRISLRRWYVTLPVLLVLGSLGTAYAMSRPQQYVATSTGVVVGPYRVEDPDNNRTLGTNPFLSLSNSLTSTTSVLQLVMDSDSSRERYADQGLLPDYEVTFVDSVLDFWVSGTDPEIVVGTAQALLVKADEEIAALQAAVEVPATTRISVIPLDASAEAIPDASSTMFLLAAVWAGALVIGGIGAIVVEGAAGARAARARRRSSAGGPDAPLDVVDRDQHQAWTAAEAELTPGAAHH